jgi:hypothetical protein
VRPLRTFRRWPDVSQRTWLERLRGISDETGWSANVGPKQGLPVLAAVVRGISLEWFRFHHLLLCDPRLARELLQRRCRRADPTKCSVTLNLDLATKPTVSMKCRVPALVLRACWLMCRRLPPARAVGALRSRERARLRG